MIGGQKINSNIGLCLKNHNIIILLHIPNLQNVCIFPHVAFKTSVFIFYIRPFICPFTDVCSHMMVLGMHG